MTTRQREIVAAVDVGTSQIRVAIARICGEGDTIEVIGHAVRDCEGNVVKGEITDMSKTQTLLKEAVREAERLAGHEIDSDRLYVGVTGSHVKCNAASAVAHVDSDVGVVERHHVEEAIEAARASASIPGTTQLCVIDGDYVLDDTRHVSDPIGQTAGKLEARTRKVIGDANRVDTFLSPLKELGFERPNPAFSGIATAWGLLKSDDFEHGALVIDMGAGTTEYVLFHNYLLVDCGVITVGLDHVANDLSLALDIHVSKARRIVADNAARRRRAEGHFDVDVGIDGRRLPVESIEKVMDARLFETFEIIRHRIDESLVGNGVIYAGGLVGISCAEELLRRAFAAPAFSGAPKDSAGPEPFIRSFRNHCVLGLLRYGADDLRMRKSGGGLVKSMSNGIWRIGTKIIKGVTDVFNI